MRKILPILACSTGLLVGACEPLMRPMFDRLSPTQQANVNQSWNNMLATPNRVDRQTLLGVISDIQLFQAGITHGSFHTEKSIATGTVVMDITYEEENPARDRFEIRVYDLAWKLLRSETYNRHEVEEMEKELALMNAALDVSATQPATQKWIAVPLTQPATLPAEEIAKWQEQHKAALALREKLNAATEPAMAE